MEGRGEKKEWKKAGGWVTRNKNIQIKKNKLKKDLTENLHLLKPGMYRAETAEK